MLSLADSSPLHRLSTHINLQTTKEEFVSSLAVTLCATQLSSIRSELFSEAKQKGLVHSQDVLVKRKPSVLRSLPTIHSSDIWCLMNALTNNLTVPRTMVKNGKRGTSELDKWRNSDKCKKLIELAIDPTQTLPQSDSQSNLSLSQSQLFPSVSQVHPQGQSQGPESDLSINLTSSQLPSPPRLPLASEFSRILISKEINSMKRDIQDIRSQLLSIERSSNTSIIMKDLQHVKDTISTLMANGMTHRPQVYQSSCTSSRSEVPTQDSVASLPKCLKIASLNCRGLHSSRPYIEDLAEGADIVALSEHWLWPFELGEILPLLTQGSLLSVN